MSDVEETAVETTEAPQLAAGGNVEEDSIFVQAEKAMMEDDAPDADAVETDGGGEPKGVDATATEEPKGDEAPKPDEKPDEKPEPDENLANGFYALRRKREKIKERETLLGQREEVVLRAQPVVELYNKLESEDYEAFLSGMAKASGRSPHEVFQRMVEHFSGKERGERGEPERQRQLDPEELERNIMRGIEAKLAEQRQSQQARYWQGYLSEANTLAAQERFPALAAMNEAKRVYEISNSIEWAMHNRPDLLENKESFLGLLNETAQDELDQQYQAYQRLRGNGSHKVVEATPAAPLAKEADAPKRTTITEDDTSETGAVRPLSEQEMLEQASRLFE